MITLRKSKRLILLFSFLMSVAVHANNGYPILEKNIKAKQYQLAYIQALKLRELNEGDPRFDYLYGLSALETGHYNEAVFALDRVTISTPSVIRPRLELARAYLKLNNKIAALKEFSDVLALSPPPLVKKNISTYIAQIKSSSRKQVPKSVIKRLASFSIGYDDNINFGNSNTEVDLPSFGLVTLSSSLVKQKSGFAEAKFQLMHQIARSNTKSTFLLGNITHRKYFKTSDFNFTDVDLQAGFAINRDKKQFQFVVRDRPVFLDGQMYSNTFGIDGIIRKKIARGKVLSSSVSLEKYDNKEQPLNDRKRITVGLKLNQSAGSNQQRFSLLAAKEFPDKDAGKPMSRNIIGIGYKASHEWSLKNTSFLNLDYRKYKHQAPYSIFPNIRRKDDRFIIAASHELQLTKKATLVLSVKHINNTSNIDLYDAKRNELKAGVRYEWD